jgi:hypothetical protein
VSATIHGGASIRLLGRLVPDAKQQQLLENRISHVQHRRNSLKDWSALAHDFRTSDLTVL